MTCREKLKIDHPELVGDVYGGGCVGCPHNYGYIRIPDGDPCPGTIHGGDLNPDYCSKCWDQEV